MSRVHHSEGCGNKATHSFNLVRLQVISVLFLFFLFPSFLLIYVKQIKEELVCDTGCYYIEHNSITTWDSYIFPCKMFCSI